MTLLKLEQSRIDSEYRSLLRSICRNNKDDLKKILNHTSTSIIINELFNIAIEHNYIEIIKTLLDYFENTQLAQCENEYEQLFLRSQMRDVLELAIEDVTISDEMQAVISSYIQREYEDIQTIEDSDIDSICNSLETSDISDSYLIDDNLGFQSHNTSDDYAMISGATHQEII